MNTNLTTLTVYANEEQKAVLLKAADLENRSLSNYLLNLGLAKARELGVAPTRETKP